MAVSKQRLRGATVRSAREAALGWVRERGREAGGRGLGQRTGRWLGEGGTRERERMGKNKNERKMEWGEAERVTARALAQYPP